MSLLSQVKTGKLDKPHLVLLYGSDGVGKSTFAAGAPDAIFLGTEDGTANLDVARFPAPKSFGDVIEAITELTTQSHKYKTLVIDSLDWLEPLVWNKVCDDGGVENIEDFGYGKGYTKAMSEWEGLIARLSALQQAKQMNVVLIAHSQVKTFNDPHLNEAYDRHQLKLNEKAAAKFREFAHNVLFASYRVSTMKDKGGRKAKAFGEGERVVYTERRPAFDAKNRDSLPFEIELSWQAYADAVTASKSETPDKIREEIGGLLESVKKKELRDTVISKIEAAGKDVGKLKAIKRRLVEVVNGGNND